MATTYNLIFKNNSDQVGDICVYQTDPNIKDPYVMSLAWYAKRTNPDVTDKFTWTIDYCYVWDETGELIPGVTFEASQTVGGDLKENNSIEFTKENGAYQFDNLVTDKDYNGTLHIQCDDTVPPKEAAVGIGMSGAGTFVRQAEPNMGFSFTPHPQYWVTFGNFEQGQVIDITQISQVGQVQFPPNVYSMTATLNADNTWTVEPTT